MNTPEMPDVCCGRCYHMHESDLDPASMTRTTSCRAMPPQVSLIPTNRGVMPATAFPPVTADKDWCGQFKRKTDT